MLRVPKHRHFAPFIHEQNIGRLTFYFFFCSNTKKTCFMASYFIVFEWSTFECTSRVYECVCLRWWHHCTWCCSHITRSDLNSNWTVCLIEIMLSPLLSCYRVNKTLLDIFALHHRSLELDQSIDYIKPVDKYEVKQMQCDWNFSMEN